VSPAAYLAELLNYTLKNLTNATQAIDLDFLKNTFHQPFGDLPADCDSVEKPVRQVRICIEVLRSYLGKRPLAASAREAALAKAEKEYLIEAYTTLLSRIGTSYEQIRLARAAKFVERKTLAERLSIGLTVPRTDPKTTPGDELDQLFLDPEATSPSVRALTETVLERLFGLADTTRYSLSEGVKLGDDPDATKAVVTRWNLNGTIWNKNTDEEGKVYLAVSQVSGMARVEVFRDAARKEMVASGSQTVANKPVRVTPTKGSGLSGTFVVAAAATSSKIEIAAIPKFLCWRLKNLRKLWEQQDRPEDAYTPGQVSAELDATGLVFPSLTSGNTIEYLPFNRLLMYTGVMTPDDRTALLGVSSTNADYPTAVNRLYVESQRPPVIDPDLIGPDDFRVPVAKTNATDRDAAFDLWLERRKFVDKQLSALAAITITDPVRKVKTPDVATLFKEMYKPVDYRGTKRAAWSATTPQSDFNELLKDLTAGKSDSTAAAVEAAKLRIRNDLNLTPDMFTRLMQLHTKADDARATPPRSELLTEEETQDLLSILVNAQKTIFWTTWRKEEEDLETRAKEPLFSHEFFWPSIREPKEGEWPLVAIKDVPFIDPDIVKPADLPEPTVGAKAKELWDARRKELEKLPADLKADREENGFESMLKLAFGPPSPGPWRTDLNQLKSDLASTTAAVVDKAQEKITKDLHLTEESFRRLMAIEAKDAKTKPEERPTAVEYAEVYTILANASELKLSYPKWAADEKTAGLDTNYWQTLKAHLPKWRASFEARQAWKQALAMRTRDPIIDPDLIDFGDLRDSMAGKAFDILKSRIDWLRKRRSDPSTRTGLVEIRGAGDLAGFKAIVKAALGIDPQVLVTLSDDNKKGQSIEARLEQLNLTNASFTYLLRVRDLAANGQPIIDAEWEAVYSILVQAQKRRRYAAWREEERIAGIILAPDHFRIPEPTAITFPPPKPRKFDPWRASWVARRDWQDIMQSRIDQESGVIAGMHEAVSGTEEAVLPLLRDTLANYSAYFGTDLDERATWLTGRLFIDAKAGGCQKTTRVAQAIETLQDLLMAARTGQLRRNFTEVKQIPGWFGSESRGGDIAIADISGNGPDLVVFHIDKGSSGNEGYYRVGWNLDAYGNVTGGWTWTKTPDPDFKVPGPLGTEIQGAGIAIADIDGNGDPDLIVFYVENSPSGIKGFYRIGWNLDTNGKVTGTTRWSTPFSLPSGLLPREIQGAAITIADITGTGKRDLVVFYIDTSTSPPDNYGNYLIGWNLDASGNVTGGSAGWSGPKTVSPAFGWENQGAGIAIADMNGDGTNDFLVFYVDNPSGENSGWYRVGLNLNTSGDVVPAWSNENQPPMQVPGWFGHETQGAGVAVADIGGNGRPNLAVFHIDNARGENVGYYRIGWEIATPNLRLEPEHFDEEWKWMGSYASWRAAMFVFLYPENILHPSLHRPRTPAFKFLIDETRKNRRLTPKDACDLAGKYSDYFRDVCLLNIEATCQTKTRLNKGNECHTVEADERSLFYMFGRAPSGKVYWSRFDPLDQSGYAQTFWEEVRGFKDVQVVRIIGSTPVGSTAAMTREDRLGLIAKNGLSTPVKRFIYLFALILENNAEKLVFTKFNLLTSQWDQGKTPVKDLPPNLQLQSLTIVPVQTARDPSLPRLALHKNGTNEVYVRGVQETGEWEANAAGWGGYPFHFKLLQSRGQGIEFPAKVEELYAAVEMSTLMGSSPPALSKWFFYKNGNGDLVYAENEITGLTNTLGPSEWLGAVPSPSEITRTSTVNPIIQITQIHVFYKNSGRAFHKLLRERASHGSPHLTFSDLSKVAAHSGSGFASHYMYAYQLRSATFSAAYSEVGDELVSSLPSRAVPRVAYPLDIPDRLDSTALRVRRQLIKQAFETNQDAYTSDPPWMWIMTYLHEAYYFVPLHLATQLQASGYYVEALDWFRTIYDYQALVNERKIYYGLELDALQSDTYKRAAGWLMDPLDPHRIASTRRYAYTRFTLMSLVRCFLDFADSEFTRDTQESIAKARTLYVTALELCDLPELKQQLDSCEKKIADFVIVIGEDVPENVQPAMERIEEEAANITDNRALASVLANIKIALTADKDWASRLNDARSLVEDAVASSSESLTMGSALGRKAQAEQRAYSRLLMEPSIERAAQTSAELAGLDFLNGVAAVTGIGTATLEKEKVDLSWLRFIPTEAAGSAGPFTPTSRAELEGVPAAALAPESPSVPGNPPETLMDWQDNPISVAIEFCIPPNPTLRFLRLRAEINLHKLRTCRNIAGMRRQLDPYAAPTDTTSGLPTVGAGGQLVLPGIATSRPTLYRYSVLIERAKQLVQIAAQIEGQMLSALEKRDFEHYTLLKARQELNLAQAEVRLQDLRVKEADGGVTLAELQRERAQIQVDTYEDWLQKGLNQCENEMIKAYQDVAAAQKGAAEATHRIQEKAALLSSFELGRLAGSAGGPVGVFTGASVFAANLNIDMYLLSQLNEDTKKAIDATLAAQIASINAAHERRKDEWQLQKRLAEQDRKIGEQEEKIAKDHVEVVKQEKSIAENKVKNANEGIEFLTNKFTNEELYDWMSGVLEGVYRFFLQQATSMAKLAENQLAFQRQEVPPAFIQADYWQMPSEGTTAGSTDGKAPDRRGLTGSARLLQDIYQLDQYAFETDKRKLQLVKVLSLSRFAPFEFQQFRETGVLTFATPIEMFDRDFPGHYLRLIKRVRTSVIALVPPTQGIHATLSTAGLSRVVIGPEVFQTVPIRRDPELVALSSPMNSTGLFELEPQSDMLLPFEGNGVESTWEFRMPRAANLFDYRTIADVLITIEYTALNSFDYCQQVIQTLRPTLSAERPFSFRNQFADQWYDLHNPEQTSTPMTVRFRTMHEDFPPNLEALKIQHVVLYFARKDGLSFEIPMTHLRFTEQGSAGAVGGGAPSIDGVISTRRGNAGSWTAIRGKSPFGEWELALPDTEEIRNRFKNEDIEDLLFVLTYTGRTPAWPA
jgi:hypothetical protein